jgi:hypothetical protein
MTTQDPVAQYVDQGYFIVDDAVEPPMLEALTAAASRVVAKVRSGEVVDDADGIRTDGEGAEPGFISGLIAPEFGEPVFAQYLGSEALARYLRPFLGDELRMGWVHLCAIAGKYHGGWHRDLGDDIRHGTYEQEMEVLSRFRKHLIKWHMALVDDPCLWIVPGSQRRYRTDEEHRCLTVDRQAEIPEALRIELRRGQTIFWNGNSIHRGKKPDSMAERATLMGGLIDHRSVYESGEKGDLPWMLADNIRDSLPDRTRRYYDNWRSLAEPRMAAAS